MTAPGDPGKRVRSPRLPPTVKWEYAALAALFLILLAPFVYLWSHPRETGRKNENKRPALIGSRNCEKCHREIFRQWQTSDHAHAMAPATPENVLGNFDRQVFVDPVNGKSSRFFSRNGHYYVATWGPDGRPGEFEIAYTFGRYPLQQYLVPFPGGRLQCLNLAWDVEKKRWFRLPPRERLKPGDWLYWTGRGQTWNSMCAECHSTRVRKNYDPKTDTFATSWFEIAVGCEACHGPGSRHREWARLPVFARQRLANAGFPQKAAGDRNRKLLAACAPCHARRYQLGDNRHDAARVLDLMVPTLLDAGIYYADGQILAEDYVYGSFLQSKMYRRGIGCDDCHNPHTLKTRAPDNRLCTRCHEAEIYDRKKHHFHQHVDHGRPSPGWLCINCHMPARVYMGIDSRRDHSIRRPRPDLSARLGVPNACNAAGCHADKSIAWSIAAFRKWYGNSGRPHFGEILKAGRQGIQAAGPGLRILASDRLKPALVRATAIDLLGRNYSGEQTTAVLEKALADDAALVRRTALSVFDDLPETTKVRLVAPKLYDPVRAVREEAAFILTTVSPAKLRPADRAAFRKNLAAYRQSLLYNSDLPGQRYNLGNLAARKGDSATAIRRWREALEIDSRFYPAAYNLALACNRRGDREKAEKLLRRVVDEQPDFYAAAYSLGLLLAENGGFAEAAKYLGRAARQRPCETRIIYNYALVLGRLGQIHEATRKLEEILQRAPDDPDYFQALAGFYLKARDFDRARRLAAEALARNPAHPGARRLQTWLDHEISRKADSNVGN